MVRIIVVYDSKSGNTESMAQAVAKGSRGVPKAEVTLKKVDQTSLEDLLNADAIIIGSPTYYGLMSAKIKDLLDRSVEIHGRLEGKVGAAFTSSGGTASGAETTLLSIIEALLIHGMIVRGRHDGKHYGAAAVGKPGEKDLTICEELGKRTAELAASLLRK
ncbi:NAD(P)H-dependent oxidoreductase [Candidatus Bathyarchaeota archaeon]|nr:NAD(P)H-dependent oxidoreductase [Candidatus Bathyarchaeota archaeon]